MFDILGKLDNIGKPSQLDLKKNMLTLPYIHVINKVSKKKQKIIISDLKYNAKRNNLDKVKSLIVDNGGIEYVNKKIEEYSSKAYDQINVFSDSKYKNLLIDAIEFNIARKF